MNKQDGNSLRGLLRRNGAAPAGPRTRKTLGPVSPINDAEAYGVAIKPAVVRPGAYYWQAVRVHHLSGAENGGNHHIYLDVLDPALPGGSSPYGNRVNGARLRVRWNGGEQTVTVDKPANEPGTNFPMWKWQVCTVEALGAAGQEFPSDVVTGLHTGHPDETTGNTLFHHSFSITFVKVKAAEQVVAESVISGVVRNAAGRTVILRTSGTIKARQTLGADGKFRFAGLPKGTYTVGVEGTELLSEAVTVDGRNAVQLDLTLILSQSVISGQVKNGVGKVVQLLRGATEVARQTVPANESFRFEKLSPGTYRVGLANTSVVSAPVTLNGVDKVVVDLVAPPPDHTIEHYVLFGPADQAVTRANLLLAHDYIVTFKPAFGFDPAEAARAGKVTIIGDTKAVAATVEQQLKAGGVPVQRLSGGIEEIAKKLAARIAGNNPFPA